MRVCHQPSVGFASDSATTPHLAAPAEACAAPPAPPAQGRGGHTAPCQGTHGTARVYSCRSPSLWRGVCGPCAVTRGPEPRGHCAFATGEAWETTRML